MSIRFLIRTYCRWKYTKLHFEFARTQIWRTEWWYALKSSSIGHHQRIANRSTFQHNPVVGSSALCSWKFVIWLRHIFTTAFSRNQFIKILSDFSDISESVSLRISVRINLLKLFQGFLPDFWWDFMRNSIWEYSKGYSWIFRWFLSGFNLIRTQSGRESILESNQGRLVIRPNYFHF